MQRRQWVMVIGLALTLGATWWAAVTPDDPAPVTRPRGVRPAAAAAAPSAAGAVERPATANRNTAGSEAVPAELPPLKPEMYTRAPMAESPADQVTLAWGPPPPPPPPVLPKGYKPPPPPPPPLPFQAIGKLEDGGSTTAFLLAADRTYAAKQGDTINNSYRVEEVTPQKIVFTFLPLKARQELSLEAR